MFFLLNRLRLGFVLLLLGAYSFGFSQQNSPWKKLSNQTVSNVYFGLGRHLYSLTGGQGFNVYLKNYNTATVTVSGKVIAKTTCGSEVSTSFSTVLQPNQESSGGNFADSSNSQTGLVTPDQCAGVKHYVSAKRAVTNRIADVYLKDVLVQISGATFTPPPIQTPVQQTVVSPTAPQVATPIYTTPTNSKYTQDSLQSIIDFLRKRNLDLQDSIVNLKSNGLGTIKRDTIYIDSKKKDNTKYKVVYITPYAGVGLESIPIVTNENQGISSTTTTSTHPTVNAGVTLAFLKQYPVSIELEPFTSYGIDLGSNICGHHFVGGGLLRVLAGLKANAPIKLFVEAGLIYREGDWSEHLTIADPVAPTTLIKAYQTNGYEYNVFRIGGGFQYAWNKGLSYIRPGLFFETPSGGSSSAILNIDGQINRRWKFGISYGDNYYAAGKIVYPTNYNNESETYFNLKLVYNIKTL
jgi:hypothetical protein